MNAPGALSHARPRQVLRVSAFVEHAHGPRKSCSELVGDVEQAAVFRAVDLALELGRQGRLRKGSEEEEDEEELHFCCACSCIYSLSLMYLLF